MFKKWLERKLGICFHDYYPYDALGKGSCVFKCDKCGEYYMYDGRT